LQQAPAAITVPRAMTVPGAAGAAELDRSTMQPEDDERETRIVYWIFFITILLLGLIGLLAEIGP
jgi:hypothetical protein